MIFNYFFNFFLGKDGSKVTTVVATPGQGADRVQEVSYTDTKVIGNGSFGVVFQAKLCDTGELVAIKKVLQDRRFKVCVALKQRFDYDIFDGDNFSNCVLFICLIVQYKPLILFVHYCVIVHYYVRIFQKIYPKLTYQ